MSTYLLIVLTGLGSGAVFAALATGLVVTYKGTGVINFATGAVAAWSAYVVNTMRLDGDLVLPVVFVPDRIHIGTNTPLVACVLLGVAEAAVFAMALHLLVFRPLRNAPALARIVASAGAMLATQALIALRFGSGSKSVAPMLPNDPIKFGTVAVPLDRLLVAALVVVSAVGLWGYFKFTRVGLSTRAASENERAAGLAGMSPDRLAAINWIISTCTVGLLAILASPITGLDPTSYTLYIVPALACALVGRLSSIGLVVTAGLALGGLNAEIGFLTSKPWWPSWASVGVSAVIPVVAVIAVLFLIGGSLPTRGAAAAEHLPTVPRQRPRVVSTCIWIGLAVFALALTRGSYRFGIITSLIVTIVAMSLVILTGLLGQVSFAQAGLAGVAGFAVSKAAVSGGIGFPLAPLIGASAAAIVGVLVGLPALRIRGPQLAIVTLATALAIEQFVLRNPNINSLSGNRIPPARLFGIDFSIRRGSDTARLAFGLLVLAIVVLVALGVANLKRSATGRRFLAIRSNERASASAGISVTVGKLVGFGLSAFVVGIGGSLMGYSRGSLSADSFTVLVGVSWLVFAYLGGITSISGAVVAGTFAPLGITYVIFDRAIGSGSTAYQLFAAVSLIVTAIFNPQGISGAFGATIRRILRQRGSDVSKLGAPPDVAAVDDTATDSPATADTAVRASKEPMSPSPRRASRTAPPVLETRDLTVMYGGVCALDRFSMSVHIGEIVGLLGANGAGKTSFIDAVTGFTPARGTVLQFDTPLDQMSAHRRARCGLRRTWQSIELFHDLTVLENVLVAIEQASITATTLDLFAPGRQFSDLNHANELLALVGLHGSGSMATHELSLGQQKLLGVARALAGSPRVLLLDEPAAGLSTMETRELGKRLRAIASTSDIGVLLVEHDVEMVLAVSDHVYVLDFGRMIESGTPNQIRVSRPVAEAYLGTARSPSSEPQLIVHTAPL